MKINIKVEHAVKDMTREELANKSGGKPANHQRHGSEQICAFHRTGAKDRAGI